MGVGCVTRDEIISTENIGLYEDFEKKKKKIEIASLGHDGIIVEVTFKYIFRKIGVKRSARVYRIIINTTQMNHQKVQSALLWLYIPLSCNFVDSYNFIARIFY